MDSATALEKKKSEALALTNALNNIRARMWFELVDQNSADTAPVGASTKFKLAQFGLDKGWERHQALCVAQLKQVRGKVG